MMVYRVATISFDPYPHEPRALRQVEAAVDGGYAVDIICCGTPGQKRIEVRNGTRIYRIPIAHVAGDTIGRSLCKWCAFLVVAAFVMAWLHVRRRYRVVHVHNMPDFLVFAALVPRLLGAKIILDIQDVSPELLGARLERDGRLRTAVIRLALWQEYISIAFAHHVMTTGEIFEDILLKRGVSKKKITSILNSANPRVFPAERRCTPPGDSGGNAPLVFMYHGTLTKRNGLDIAVRAVAIARTMAPNIQLHIQGDGDQLSILKDLATELGIDDIVVFTDFTPIDDLVTFVIRGDVGIIPYRCLGFSEYVLPTKAYEYAWMQRPIIGSNTVAMRSMFGPESIILCDPEKPESFAEAMVDLYRHPEKRACLAANAFGDYEPYRWELMARIYQDLLGSLCRSRHAGTTVPAPSSGSDASAAKRTPVAEGP